MIRIRNERDFSNWFGKNHKTLGFESIVQKDMGEFPDYVVLEDGKEKNVELEIKSSNFILHKHPKNKIDCVICVINDVKLDIPTIVIKNVKLIEYNKETRFDYKKDVYKFVKKEKIVTSSDVAKNFGMNWATADRLLMELLIDKKIQRIKKAGVTVWMLS